MGGSGFFWGMEGGGFSDEWLFLEWNVGRGRGYFYNGV